MASRGMFQAFPPTVTFQNKGQSVSRVNNSISDKYHVPNNKNIIGILKGDYVATASSTASPTSSAIKAFGNISESWRSGSTDFIQVAYNNGKYVGGGRPNLYFTTTTTMGEKINGEWLEIKLPYKLQITKYILSNQPFPTKFTLLGTNDGSAWTIVDRRPSQTQDSTVPGNYEVSPDIKRQFNIFRIVFEALSENNDRINIGEIKINGLKPRINLAGQIYNFQTYYNNDMRTVEGYQSTMESEQQLLHDLNDFNAKYAEYIACTTNLGAGNCSDGDKNTAYAKLVSLDADGNNILDASGNNTSGSIFDVSTSLTENNANVTHSAAQTQYNSLKSTHKDIMKMRGELDAKLKELHVTDDSFAYEQKRVFDGTVYTSLIWTVLATSTLFFAFRHL